MKEIAVQSWDDLDYAEDGSKVPAPLSVTLSLNGKTVELDLTEQHVAELSAYLRPWFKAGRKPDAPKVSSGPGRKPAAYYEGMQAYAASQGIHLVESVNGGFYYPRALRRAYEDYLAGQED